MHKEPIGLYIFRFVVGLGLFAFMLMLYWSSNALEQDMHELKESVSEIENDIFEARMEIQKSREDLLTAFLEEGREYQNVIRNVVEDNSKDIIKDRPHINSAYPNLLEEDPFYTTTLPELVGKGFKSHGTLQIADFGKPHNFHPFSNWGEVRNLLNRCQVSIYELQFGKYETMAPRAAIKLEQRALNEFWVHLRDDMYWQPLNPKHFSKDFILAPNFLRKHKVTSHDFKFRFDAIMNPHVQESLAVIQREYFKDITEFEVIDDYTFVIRWKTENIDGQDKIKYSAKGLMGSLMPLARFVYQYFPDGEKIIENDSESDTYRNNSVWAQNFSNHWAQNIIVSCGPWLFDGMTESAVKFRRNPDFFNKYAALTDRVHVTYKETQDAIWQDFKAEKTTYHLLAPDQIAEFENFLQSEEYQQQKYSIKRLDHLNHAYGYIGWNQASPLFESKKVRRAMTMAIDRDRIIQQHLNNKAVPITGNFFINSPSTDKTILPWPYDPQEARALLEEEGWYDSDGDGVIDKVIDGKRIPFEFSITYYVKSTLVKGLCEYISTALKDIGIVCHLDGVDIADLDAKKNEKNFDAITLAWGFGTPPENPRQIWHSSGAKEKGSSNSIGFSVAEADEIIKQLEYEYDSEERLKLYHRFHRIIHEEQPYTFLMTSKRTLLYRDYLENVFIPSERQDLVPGANIAIPDLDVCWLDK
jgi:peptide/nickel transport system substrate-binding protein